MTKRPIHEEFALGPVKTYTVTSLGYKNNQGRKRSAKSTMAKAGSSFVYAIGCDEHDFVKFGKSDDPHNRIEALQISSPFVLNFLCIVEVDIKDVFLLEGEIHKRLGILGLSGNGEWFDIRSADCVGLICDAAKSTGVSIRSTQGGETVDLKPVGYNEYGRSTKSIISRSGGSCLVKRRVRC